MRLTKEKVKMILENKKSMLAVLPKATHSHAYTDLFRLDHDWYCTVMGLSENLSNSKKRATKFNWDCDLDLDYLANLWFKQQGRCALTGVLLDYESGSSNNKNPYRTSIDRIDNSKGYVRGNVRLLTHWANNAKSTWGDDIFETFVKTANKVLTKNA
jgi:hypothetical protein